MTDVSTEERMEEAPAERPRRHLPPMLYPVLALAFAGLLVFSFSRILLAVSKTAAVAVALFAALNILVGGALVAYGRRARRLPASWPLLVGAGIAVVATGLTAMAVGEPEGENGHGGGGVSVPLVAADLAFDVSEIRLPPEAEVTMPFENRDQGIPHNVAIYGDESGADAVFVGDIIDGGASTTYTFTSPAVGEYIFRCDVHPTDMVGTVVVEEGPGGGDGGGDGGGGDGGPPGAEIAAANLAFDTSELAVPGGGEVVIAFDNQEAVAHNLSVYADDTAAEAIFQGEIVTGPARVEYRFQAPPPGEYYFRCDVHPAQMEGVLLVE